MGSRFALDDLVLSEAQIIDFARRFDAQPFHVDPAAAAAGPFGGLVASGLQTVSELVSRWVSAVMVRAAGLGSPAIEAIRFLQPVRPSRRYTARAEVIGSRRSRRDPTQGVLTVLLELADSGTPVLTVEPIILIATRPGRTEK
ncbi:acyl dehydratase [Amycolatopsis sp. K13G38]|uniref:Acyl dehydratase n=1 Tax=Amycolatopsis acididurans TaxID=2724524 RepID=A0ABX1JG46_9PSEU|nr:acyl dehydratase [Amycolatopsis acididurans]